MILRGFPVWTILEGREGQSESRAFNSKFSPQERAGGASWEGLMIRGGSLILALLLYLYKLLIRHSLLAFSVNIPFWSPLICLSHSLSILLFKILISLPCHCFASLPASRKFDLVILLFKIPHKVEPMSLHLLQKLLRVRCKQWPRVAVHHPSIPAALGS